MDISSTYINIHPILPMALAKRWAPAPHGSAQPSQWSSPGGDWCLAAGRPAAGSPGAVWDPIFLWCKKNQARKLQPVGGLEVGGKFGSFVSFNYLHPGRLTAGTWGYTSGRGKSSSKPIIFRFYVNLWGCISYIYCYIYGVYLFLCLKLHP